VLTAQDLLISCVSDDEMLSVIDLIMQDLHMTHLIQPKELL